MSKNIIVCTTIVQTLIVQYITSVRLRLKEIDLNIRISKQLDYELYPLKL